MNKLKPFLIPLDKLNNIIDSMSERYSYRQIASIDTFEKAYEWFQTVVGQELCIALKVDGVYIKSYYVSGHFVYAYSDDTEDAIDYTSVISKVIPPTLIVHNTNAPFTGVINGVCFVESDALDELSTKYQRSYTDSKTAAAIMLNIEHDDEDYKYLYYNCYNKTGYGSLDDRIDNADKTGFYIVPYSVDRWEGGTFEEFKSWCEELIYCMQRLSELAHIKSNGLIIEIDEPSRYRQKSDEGYDSSSIILTMGEW